MNFPRFSGHRWLSSRPLFKLHGTEIAQRGMMAGPIVKSLHVLKDRRFGLPAESKTGAPWNTIPFSGWQEPLHHGMVPTNQGKTRQTRIL